MTNNNEIFRVSYTNKDIMKKLDEIHTEQKITNGRVKLHSKLIFGAYSFTLTVLVLLLSVGISIIKSTI